MKSIYRHRRPGSSSASYPIGASPQPMTEAMACFAPHLRFLISCPSLRSRAAGTRHEPGLLLAR